MSDSESINAAYADAVQSLYQVMMTAYAAAGGNRQVERKANEVFSSGILLARRVRDEAKRLSA
jgi:hypothetical protein